MPTKGFNSLYFSIRNRVLRPFHRSGSGDRGRPSISAAPRSDGSSPAGAASVVTGEASATLTGSLKTTDTTVPSAAGNNNALSLDMPVVLVNETQMHAVLLLLLCLLPLPFFSFYTVPFVVPTGFVARGTTRETFPDLNNIHTVHYQFWNNYEQPNCYNLTGAEEFRGLKTMAFTTCVQS